MVDTQSKEQPRRARWGWIALLAVSALIGLNGLLWLFVGPDSVLTRMAETIGESVTSFQDAYPAAVEDITDNAQQVAIYLMAVGAMGFLAAFAGFRKGAQSVWRITWVLVATPAAIAATGLGSGVSAFVAAMLVLTLIGLIGQVLAHGQSGENSCHTRVRDANESTKRVGLRCRAVDPIGDVRHGRRVDRVPARAARADPT